MSETEIRYRTERTPLAFRHRIALWWEDVSFALSDLGAALKSWPDKYYTAYIEMKPGEPGYEDAPYESYVVDSHPMRFDLKDGEWVRREESP